MKVQGLIKRPRRGPVHSPGAQATEHRIETREIRSYESEYVLLCGIWIFTTARCAFYSIKAVGLTNCCWASLMIIPACAAMPNGIWPKEPKSSVTVCLKPCKSEPCLGL